MPYLTGRRPSQEIAIQIRMSAAFERSMQASSERALSEAIRDAADAIEQGAPVNMALQRHRERMQQVYRGAYQVVIPAFGDRILSAAGKSWRQHLRVKNADERFDEETRRLIEIAGTRAVVASETTQNQIRAAILAGEQAGMSQAVIAAQIRAGVPDLPGINWFTPRVRSLVIARTEVHTAAQSANNAAALATGVVEGREWVAAEDSRTRPDHNEADAQVVGVNERFQVGNTTLQYPGEHGAPASQVVNCRCAVVFIT